MVSRTSNQDLGLPAQIGRWSEDEDRCEMKTALEKRSIMVRITVLPLDGGRLVTKSKTICDQGWEGIGRGCNRPVYGKLEDLF